MVFLQEQKEIKVITDSDNQRIWNDTNRLTNILSSHKLKYNILDSSDSDDDDELNLSINNYGNASEMPYVITCFGDKCDVIAWSTIIEYEKLGLISQKFRYLIEK